MEVAVEAVIKNLCTIHHVYLNLYASFGFSSEISLCFVSIIYKKHIYISKPILSPPPYITINSTTVLSNAYNMTSSILGMLNI